MHHRTVIAMAVVGLASALNGCAEKPPEMGLVSGVVTVNGKPLSKLVVTFLPEPDEKGKETPITASGETDESGKYELQCYFKGQPNAGVPTGWNRVLVTDSRQSHLPQGQPPPPRLISLQYAQVLSTPLRFEVKPGPQTIDLKLDK